jgi:Mrp family chromosome partitioning ATPase
VLSVATAPAFLGEPGPPQDFEGYRTTVAALLKSRPVLEQALGRPEVQDLPMLAREPDRIEYLRNEIQTDFTLGPGLLRVSLRGARPEELAHLVNAVTAAALEELGRQERREKEQELRRLEQVRQGYERDLAGKRRRLKGLAERVGGSESAPAAVLALARLGAKQAELAKAEGELKRAEALLRTRAPRPESGPEKPASPSPQPDGVAKPNAELQGYLTQLADLRQEAAQINRVAASRAAAEKVRKERGLDERIAAQERKVEGLGRMAPPPPPRTDRGADPARAGDGAGQLADRVALYKEYQEQLRREIDGLAGEAQAMKISLVEMESIRKDIAPAEEVSQSAARRLEVLRAGSPAPARVSLVEEAQVPSVREERRVTYAGLTGLGAFALALLGVALVESRARRVYTLADVAQGLEIPVVSTLSPRPACGGEALAWYMLPDGGVDTVRALLMRGPVGPGGRVVLVISAAGGEGTTALAVRLAASLARANRRTLLIDANLRRPAAHGPFGVAAEPGLAEVLRGEAAAASAVRAAPLDRLWLLPAGRGDHRALHALARPEGPADLDQFQRDYEYVIIDGAPLLPAAEVLPLAQRADAVLLSVRGGVSRVPAVHAAWQRLGVLGAPRLGAVMQGVTV